MRSPLPSADMWLCPVSHAAAICAWLMPEACSSTINIFQFMTSMLSAIALALQVVSRSICRPRLPCDYAKRQADKGAGGGEAVPSRPRCPRALWADDNCVYRERQKQRGDTSCDDCRCAWGSSNVACRGNGSYARRRHSRHPSSATSPGACNRRRNSRRFEDHEIFASREQERDSWLR